MANSLLLKKVTIAKKSTSKCHKNSIIRALWRQIHMNKYNFKGLLVNGSPLLMKKEIMLDVLFFNDSIALFKWILLS